MPSAIAAIRRCLLKELKLYCFGYDCTYSILDNQHWPALALRGHALSDIMSYYIYSKERAQEMALVVVSRVVAVEAR
jgi:hypothetical protein